MAQRRTKKLTISRALASAMLASLSARPAAALLSTPTVHLMTNTPLVTPDDVPGTAYTEAAYTGYAAAALPTPSAPVREDGGIQSVVASVTFIAPSPLTVTGTITGYYLTDGAGTGPYGAEVFDAPVPMVNPGDYLELDVVLPLQLISQLA